MDLMGLSTESLNKLNQGLNKGQHYDNHLEVGDLAESVVSSGAEWFRGAEIPFHLNLVRIFVNNLSREQRQELLTEAIDCVFAFRNDE